MKSAVRHTALALVLASSAAFANATVVATNSTYGVYDGTAGNITLSVGTHGTISDLNLSVTFSKCDDPAIGPDGTACVGIGNSFDDEISFILTGPDGTIFNLVNFGTYGGRSSLGRITLTFDSQAATDVGGALAAGSFKPLSSLDDFNGRDMFGDYTLSIADQFFRDPLEFFSASLDVTLSDPASAVPEPGVPALLGLGLLGLWTARRRNAR